MLERHEHINCAPAMQVLSGWLSAGKHTLINVVGLILDAVAAVPPSKSTEYMTTRLARYMDVLGRIHQAARSILEKLFWLCSDKLKTLSSWPFAIHQLFSVNVLHRGNRQRISMHRDMSPI